MKKRFSALPGKMKHQEKFFDMVGCSWMEFVTAIPSPLFVVTSYKANGLPNACLQTWATFVGDGDHAYCIMAKVNRDGHMYQTIKETGELVINLPGANVYDQCTATIMNNQYDADEITASGLTARKSELVNAPLIEECFLNLECQYHWEKELNPGSGPVLCVKVVGIQMDSALFADETSRYGDDGYLYFIHRPMNPVTGAGRHDGIATLNKLRDVFTY